MHLNRLTKNLNWLAIKLIGRDLVYDHYEIAQWIPTFQPNNFGQRAELIFEWLTSCQCLEWQHKKPHGGLPLFFIFYFLIFNFFFWIALCSSRPRAFGPSSRWQQTSAEPGGLFDIWTWPLPRLKSTTTCRSTMKNRQEIDGNVRYGGSFRFGNVYRSHPRPDFSPPTQKDAEIIS